MAREVRALGDVVAGLRGAEFGDHRIVIGINDMGDLVGVGAIRLEEGHTMRHQCFGPGLIEVRFLAVAGVGRIGAEREKGTAAPKHQIFLFGRVAGQTAGPHRAATVINSVVSRFSMTAQTKSPLAIRLTPAAAMALHAATSEPWVSMPRQASSITQVSKPALRASSAVPGRRRNRWRARPRTGARSCAP